MNFEDEASEHDGFDSDDQDLEEIEIALYSQIHHEQNTDLVDLDESLGISRLFEVEDRNNAKEGDCILFEGKPSQKFVVSQLPAPPALPQVKKEGDGAEKTDSAKKKKKKKKKKVKEKPEKPPVFDSSFVPYVDSDEEELIVIDSTGDDEDGDDDITLANVKSNLLLNCDEIKDMDIAAIHDRMPDQGWKIDAKDRSAIGGTRMQKRYYTTFDVRCRNCDEKGHLSKLCPLPPKLPTCCLCSELGHTNRNCPNMLCFNCSQPGHTSRECSKRRRNAYDSCHRCRQYGHMKHECPDLWRQFHLTVHGSGYPPVQLPKSENKRVFCYNCGSKGHFGHECDEELMDRFRNLLVPFIARYDMNRPHHGTKRKHDDYEEPSRQSNKRFKREGNSAHEFGHRQTQQQRNTPHSRSKNTESSTKSRNENPWARSLLNTSAKTFLSSKIGEEKKNKKSKKRQRNEEQDFPRGHEQDFPREFQDSKKRKNWQKEKNWKNQQRRDPVDSSAWWNKSSKAKKKNKKKRD